MGGDGGTISSNRTYLRGAGKACHTADHPSNAAKRAKLEDTERAQLILTTCAISGAVLDLTPSKEGGGSSCSGADIVVCPYGKLYKREEALEALLRRSQQVNTNGADALGSHVRGMKDLHPVRFYVTASASKSGINSNNNDGNGRGTMARYVATCPITSGDIGSGNVPSFVIVRTKNPKSKDKKKKDSSPSDNTDTGVEFGPNVISERAIKEMGIEGLQSEYGPFEERNMIRLAPPKAGGVFEEIQQKWEARVEEERLAKLQKKKDKKRKRGTNEVSSPKSKKSETKTSLPASAAAAAAAAGAESIISEKKSSVAEEARSNIQTKVAHNPVLSSLFGSAGKKNQSEKEKRDALFTRNC